MAQSLENRGDEDEFDGTLPESTFAGAEPADSDELPDGTFAEATLPAGAAERTVPSLRRLGDTPPPETDGDDSGGIDTSGLPGGRSSGPGPDEGETFADRFRIERMLGEGGMGRVYLVQDTHLDQRSALKMLSPKFSRNEDFRRMFLREIKTAQQFVSPRVNQVRDTGVAGDGTLYFTMDLVEGEDLSALMKREDLLNVRHALDITLQVLEGLQSGHDNGFVHRDIKPSNIMLANRVPKTGDNPFGVDVRLLDFGIAGLAAEFDGGTLVGTPSYMSPEQVQRKPLDHRTDLFAVGIVLYEMIAGARLFQGKTVAQITSSILDTDVAPKIADLSNLSKPLQQILKRALEKDREKRFQSASDFIRAIEQSKAYQLPKVMPGWAGAGLGILLLAAAGEGFLLHRSQGELRAKDERIAGLNADLIEANGDKRSLQAKIDTLEASQVSAADIKGVEEKTEQRFDDEELKRLQREVGTLTSEVARLRENESASQRTIQQQIKELGEKQAAIASLEGKLQVAQRSDSALFQVTRAIDDQLLFHLAALNAEKAGDTLGYLYDKFPAELTGHDYLGQVTELAGVLADPSTAGGRLDALASRVEKGYPAFEVDAAWLKAEETAKESGRPPRAERFRELVLGDEGLLARARELSDELARAGADRLNDILGAPPLDGPQAALDYAREVGTPEAAAAVGRRLGDFADALLVEAVRDDQLDPRALAGLTALEEWARVLASSTHGALARGESGRNVLRLRHAQRWFAEPDFLADPAQAGLFDTGPGEPQWWKPLRLAHALVAAGSGYPVPANGQLHYRFVRGGRTYWNRQSPVGHPTTEAAGRVWRIDTRTFDEAGTKVVDKGEMAISLSGKVFRSGSDVVLRLDGRVPLAVRDWTPSKGGTPPSTVVRSEDSAAFLDELRRNPEPCLVFTDGDTVRWFSPRYGLVREVNGTTERELVHANL